MDRLEQITDRLLASYEEGGDTNHIDGANLPSKRAIATICEDLLQLLFPGFHDQEPIHSQHLRRVTSYRVQSVAERLGEEICKSLRLKEPDCPKARAETHPLQVPPRAAGHPRGAAHGCGGRLPGRSLGAEHG